MSPVPDVLPKIEPNLLFGTIALLRGLITSEQFARAATAWSASFKETLGDFFVNQKILTKAEQLDVQRDIARIIVRHGGEPDPNLEFEVDRIDPLIREFDPSNLTRTYSLIRVLETGGMGQIFVARDKLLHRLVALKEVKPDLCERSYQRILIKEAQIAAQLEHPNILPIYELGLQPAAKLPYYTMPLVSGTSLKEAIQDFHRQKEQGESETVYTEFLRLINAFVCVCNAIAYAHSRGVIHRDLKPSNVLLGEFGQVFVVDWGLAKLIQVHPQSSLGSQSASPPSLVNSSSKPVELSEELQNLAFDQFAGTPAYMAPEQFERQANMLNERTDIYGLGCILFEIAHGHHPTKTSQSTENGSVQQTQTTPNSSINKLDAICAKAMADQQSDRHSSAKELGEEVLRWLACQHSKANCDQSEILLTP